MGIGSFPDILYLSLHYRAAHCELENMLEFPAYLTKGQSITLFLC